MADNPTPSHNYPQPHWLEEALAQKRFGWFRKQVNKIHNNLQKIWWLLRQRGMWIGIFSVLPSMALVLALSGALAFYTLDRKYERDFGSVQAVIHHNDQGVILLDRNDQPFFRFYDAQYKDIVGIEEISPFAIDALLASEDAEFFEHGGYSVRSIARAFWKNTQAGDIVEGGSTVTQQLAKNVYLSPEKTYIRKINELMIARKLEKKFTKDEILEMYLNTAYFGEGAYGIGTAARAYFNKPANELSLAEASLLIGVLKAPSEIGPITGNRTGALARQEVVLKRMQENNFITEEEYVAAKSQELQFSQPDQTQLYASRAHHFAFQVIDELKKKYGEKELKKSGFVVKTTLDSDWQAHAEEQIRARVAEIQHLGARNGAVVVLEPGSGELRAVVGSTDWKDDSQGKFDVTQGLRQPGSSFKPLVYATALDRGTITAATILNDRPVSYPLPGQAPYRPRNYDGRFHGNVLARTALSHSLNVPAVEVLNRVGLPAVLDVAQATGYTTFEDRNRFGLSFALGAGDVHMVEHVQGFGMLANLGEVVPATTILEIKNPVGETVYRHEPKRTRIVSPDAAYVIASILSDNNERRSVFGSALDTVQKTAVKTGTTQNNYDAWTIGYTPDLVVGVWLGNNEHEPMRNLPGAIAAAPVWKNLMNHYLGQIDYRWYEEPPSVMHQLVCRYNGGLVDQPGPNIYDEVFVSGTTPGHRCVFPKPKEEKPEDKPEDKKEDTNKPEQPSAEQAPAANPAPPGQ